ncbi:DUF4350 domain-containing protein [Aliiglaciecola sp. LCG003]|uniref:DUF4350 domain-containing protein n=1 Tax=Aliiglaciecola sp. LCG003 TaxID=3053655 RepID=UPI0025741B08|nr:DUF4350 domain-containing protein [Aliiglaciecola sp. LCG003]WJG10335.1 DUF4350 domain-containing protein [Aliiglaciecola sp. LCG003]
MTSANLKPVSHYQRYTVMVILTLMGLILAGYVYKNVEIYEQKSFTGFSEEARKEPYLAAKYLLEEDGKKVTLLNDYRLLYGQSTAGVYPQNKDTIIFSEGEIALSQALSDKLLEWVENGGHLILALNATTEDDGFRANALIKQLGLGVIWKDSDDFAESNIYPYATEIINQDDQVMMINLENTYRLNLPQSDNIFYTAGDEQGVTFAQMDSGNGLITLMTDAYIWDNQQIAEEDNVALLIELAGSSPHVYFFTAKELPHWFSLLYNYSPFFIWLAICLLILLMWRAAVRIGPVLNIDEHRYSPFSMHIKAAGEFYWRTDKQLSLQAVVRQAILVELAKKRPSSKGAHKSEIIAQLSAISHWPSETIDLLMFNQNKLNETQFTQRIASLQTLRKMI